MNKAVRGLSKKAEECLSSYHFPGNIRELENEIERAVVLAEEGKCIQTHHLSEKVARKLLTTGNGQRAHGKLRDMVQDLEKSVLSQMIEEHAGNKSKIAKQLGLSRFGLQKKMKRYGFIA
jgi:transcriptional regulator with PAS, ATPase and Fis domain